MFMKIVRSLFLVIASNCLALVQASPIQIDAGKISGVTLDPESGLQVFRGIPYAQPPIGDLRWSPPNQSILGRASTLAIPLVRQVSRKWTVTPRRSKVRIAFI